MKEIRNVWVDNLRSSLTVLVVAHHSTLAYTTFAKFDTEVYINSNNPIVDSKRWVGLDIFQNFNDIFFMSLMFLIGGLFLSKSIAKKGIANFTTDRALRLLIPFLFLGTLFMLIAYFPAYFLAYNDTGILAHIIDFFTIQRWPVGPPWFIWVLFLFNIVFVFLNPLIQKTNPKIVLFFENLQNKPIKFFTFLLLLTWVLYVPVAHNIGAGTWTGWGPFDFQLSRILLYFGYFLIGGLIGNTDFNNKIFSINSSIIKNWWVWVLLSIAVYTILTIGTEILTEMVKLNQLKEFYAWMIYFMLFASSCVLSCLAFITTFRKFINIENKWWTSLSDNAYLIYLVHYIFVVWTQFLLMSFDIPALAKFLIVFMIAISISWLISNLLRKVRVIRKYL